MKPSLNQQATRTTNGTQNWTDPSISSDQTLQLFFGTEATANDTTTAAAKLFIGATDLTNNIAHTVGTLDATAAGSANSHSMESTTKCLVRGSASGTETLTAAISATLSNGITINQGLSDGAAYLFNGLSLAGSDHTVHLSNTAFAATDLSKTITHGDTSAPDAVIIFASVNQTATDAASIPQRTIIGFWDGTNSASVSMKCSGSVSPTDLAARANTDLGHQIDTVDTDVATISIGSIGATTFTLSRTAHGNTPLFVTCISFRHTSGIWSAKCGITTLPGSIGVPTALVTGLATPAQVLLTVATRLTSTALAANSDAAGSLSFGVACNNNGTTQQMACAMTEKNAVTTTVSKCYTSASQAVLSLDNTGAAVDKATVSSWTGGSGNDVMLNASAISGIGAKVMYLAFGISNPAPPSSYNLSSDIYF